MPLAMKVGLGARDFVLHMGTPVPLPKKWSEPPKFPADFYCVQTALWVKMALGTEVGLSLGDFVLDGDPTPSPKGRRSPPVIGPCIVAKRLHGSRCHLVRMFTLAQTTLC